jgi:hypothetical protein
MKLTRNPKGWKAALLTMATGGILFLVCQIVAFILSDTTGDRWMPIFLVGCYIGLLIFLVGALGITIALITMLIRFRGTFVKK